jgi:predicted molibdopterin-dependent oxidoreductase YjgC
MFNRKIPIDQICSVTFDGKEIQAQIGEPVVMALLAAGVIATRVAPENHTPRGPYCLIGNCFECLVQINGSSAQQSCRTAVAPGMVIQSYKPKSA